LSAGQGVTEIAGLTPGRYVLEIRSLGPGQPAAPLVQREVEITGDMEINADDVPAGVAVTGTLRFEGPAPRGTSRLVLLHPPLSPVVLTADAQGALSAEHAVPPGTYELYLRVNDYQLIHIAAAGAKVDGQSIQIGGDDARLTLVAAKTSARITGVALKHDKPFPGALVVLVPQDMARSSLYRRDQSNSDGSFELTGIPPGAYTLIALEDGWDLEWSRAEAMRPFLAAGETVQVGLDGNYHVDARVQPANPQ
jgi:hypothetical protein